MQTNHSNIHITGTLPNPVFAQPVFAQPVLQLPYNGVMAPMNPVATAPTNNINIYPHTCTA